MPQQTATPPVIARLHRPFLAALAAALTLSLGAAGVAHAADIFVNPTIVGSGDVPGCGTPGAPCKTIQFAIDKAAVGDTIHVEDGPYFEHLVINKRLTIIGEPPGRVVDGSGTGSVITIGSDVEVTITGLTIQNGNAFRGGGILNNGTLTINNCVVRKNTAIFGGGIQNNGTLTINNSTVSDNTADVDGGGIFNDSNKLLLLNSSTVANNSSAFDGGGLLTFGMAFVHQSTIVSNGAGGDGGGIFITIGGSLTGDTSGVENNSALGKGGNIFNKSSQTATLTNVTISGGTAARGGGIDNTGTVNLNSVTITKNTATTGDGGGIFNDAGATLNVRNTILAGNTDTGGQAPDCAGTLTSQGHNLVGMNTGCTILAATGDLVGTGGSPIDPKLGPLGSNGGSTQTHALLAGSPAIDAGDPSPPGSGGTACEATDQRGVTRPQGPRCDIGAFEAPPSLARIPTVDGISQLALVLLLAGALGILTRYRARPRL